MATHHLSRVARDFAVEQALDAVIEIDEVIEGKRSDAPALVDLVSSLVGSHNLQPHPDKSDLLADSQFTTLYHRAVRSPGREYKSAAELNYIVELLIAISVTGLAQLQREQLVFLRDFCLGLNRELVAEAFSRTPESPLSRSRHQKLTPYQRELRSMTIKELNNYWKAALLCAGALIAYVSIITYPPLLILPGILALYAVCFMMIYPDHKWFYEE